jgi:small subunit ribosomal protein S14
MAKHSQIARWKRAPKFSTRKYNRCPICGRSGGYLRRFQICRICFRELAWQGLIPGIKKASW